MTLDVYIFSSIIPCQELFQGQQTTGDFRIQPWGTIQKIPTNNIDFLNSAPGVVYGKLRYLFNIRTITVMQIIP